MRLYGVQHGFEHTPGGTIESIYVNPAQEMLEAVHDLPRRSVVGIEAIHPECFEDDDSAPTIRDEDQHYWQTIGDACLDAGHDVVYMDSYGIHKTAARRRAELWQICDAFESGKYVVAPGQERTVAEVRFGLRAEATYLHAVAREDHLIRQLRKFKPDMAIIGLAHSDYVMLSPELAAEIAVDEYYKVLNDTLEPPLPVLSVLDDTPISVDQHVKQSPPNPSVLNERELAIRTYNSVAVGRVMLGMQPEWIGSWEPGNRPIGLFEVYPTTPESGIIEDRLGTATYEGEFDANGMSFTKEYVQGKILDPNAIRLPIYYEANRTSDDVYEGTWEISGFEGEFVIRRGSHLYDPVDANYGQQKIF